MGTVKGALVQAKSGSRGIAAGFYYLIVILGSIAKFISTCSFWLVHAVAALVIWSLYGLLHGIIAAVVPFLPTLWLWMGDHSFDNVNDFEMPVLVVGSIIWVSVNLLRLLLFVSLFALLAKTEEV